MSDYENDTKYYNYTKFKVIFTMFTLFSNVSKF